MKSDKLKIPQGWSLFTLKDILDYEQPYNYTVDSTNYENNGIPVLTAGKSFILGYTTENHNVYSKTPVIIFDDFTTDSKFVDFPFKVKSSAMKFLKPKNPYKLDIKVIFGHIQNLRIRETGGDHKRRWISEFSKLEVLLPPFEEQILISSIISKIDKAILNSKSLINKYNRIKTGLLHDLLTVGLNSDKSNTVSSELKQISVHKHFINSTLKSITKVRQGYQIAIANRKKYEGANRYIYITVQYLNNPKKYLEYIENPPLNVVCCKEDILFTRTGNTGQIVSGIEGVYHNNFFKVSFDEKIVTREYLLYFLKWQPVQDLIKELAGTTTIPDMKHKSFYSIPIFFPSDLEEQRKITNILDSVSHKLNCLQQDYSKFKSIKTGLMQDLLTGTVSVSHLLKEKENV